MAQVLYSCGYLQNHYGLAPIKLNANRRNNWKLYTSGKPFQRCQRISWIMKRKYQLGTIVQPSFLKNAAVILQCNRTVTSLLLLLHIPQDMNFALFGINVQNDFGHSSYIVNSINLES